MRLFNTKVMRITELFNILNLWDSLGGSVKEQLESVIMDNEDIEDQNINAIQYGLNDFLDELPQEITEIDYIKEQMRDYLNKD